MKAILYEEKKEKYGNKRELTLRGIEGKKKKKLPNPTQGMEI